MAPSYAEGMTGGGGVDGRGDDSDDTVLSSLLTIGRYVSQGRPLCQLIMCLYRISKVCESNFFLHGLFNVFVSK